MSDAYTKAVVDAQRSLNEAIRINIPLIYRVMSEMGTSQTDSLADEMFSEALMEMPNIIQQYEDARAPGGFAPFAARMIHRAMYKIIMKYKRLKRGGELTRVTTDDLSLYGAKEDDAMDRKDLEDVLSRMTEERRLLLELRYEWGYTYHHIGRILGCSYQTVSNRLTAALNSARRLA